MHSRKRIFIALITITILALGVLLAGGWLLYFNPTNIVNQVVLAVIGSVVLLSLAVASVGVIVLVVSLWSHRSFPLLQNMMTTAANILFPVAVVVGKILRIDKEVIESSFIAVNNQLVDTRDIKVRPDQLMILAPHCLQNTECQYKITIDIENCRRCGGCPVNDLHELKDKYGIRFVVATGGTLARRFVKEYRPRAIVAIACERDLSSGVQDVNPLPVIGVLNIRPHGPCFNTQVNLDQVETAVRHFIEKQSPAFRGTEHITEF